MAEHPDVALIRGGYEAFAKGDMDAVSAVFADDIAWHIPGRNQLAGDRTSKDEVFDLFGKLVELTDGTFHLEVHDIVGGDDHVVVLASEHGNRNGKTLGGNHCHVWHVSGGKAVEFWDFPADAYGEDDFWS